MRIKYTLILLLGLFHFRSGYSQELINPSKIPHTLLWEVSGKSGHKAYIYGTMHSESDKVISLGDSVVYYLNHSAEFAMEVDPDSLPDPMSLLMKVMLPPDVALKDSLSPAQYEKFSMMVTQKLGLPVTVAERIKPFFLYYILSEDSQTTQKKTGLFLDILLSKLAKKRKMEIVGLESVNSQLDLMLDIPLANQFKMMRELLDDVPKASQAMKDETKSYINADFEALSAEMDDPEIPKDFMDKMLRQRNIGMANQVDSILNKTSVFVAVGAAHLPLQDGVLNLMKQKGYHIRPVFSRKKYTAAQVRKMLD